jgi:ligand-binding sensor domain-containing protein
MNFLSRALCVTIWLCCTFQLSAQISSTLNTWKVYGYTKRDGLPDDEIVSCVTHKSGFTYVLTQNGLTRFDGNHFLRLVHDPTNKNGIPAGRINSLELDNNGNLWLLQSNSMSVLKEDGNSFENFPIPDKLEIQQLNFGLFSIDSKIWLGAKGDFIVFDLNTKTYYKSGWREFSDKQVKQFDMPVNGMSILQKSPLEIWLLGTTGLYSYQINTKEFRHYPSEEYPNMAGKALYLDKNKRLYLGSYNDGIIEFDYTKNTWKTYPAPKEMLDEHHVNSVYSIYSKSIDELFAITRKSLVTFNTETHQYHEIPLKDIQGRSLMIQPTFLQKDMATNRWWIGSKQGLFRTPESPLFKYNQLNLQSDNHFFNLYFEDYQNQQVIFGSIYTDELWIKNIKTESTEVVKQLDGIDLDFVTTIKNDKSGNSWLTMRNDVLVRKVGSKKWTKINIQNSPNGNTNRAFWNIDFDSAGYAYVCSWTDGVLQIDPNFQFVQFLPLVNKIKENRFVDLEVDQQKEKIYIATEQQGICVWDILKRKASWISLQKNQTNTLLGNSISDIEIDHKGIVWIASTSHGLSLYNPNNDSIKTFGSINGMNTDKIHWCYEDNKKRMWIASPSSIYLYHPQINTFQSFDATTGWPSEEVYRPFENVVGTVLLGTMNGYLTLSESYLNLTLQPPKVYIESVETGNRELEIHSNGTLSHEENSLSIRFGAIDYRLSSNLLFRYRLLPDTSWKIIKERELNLIGLSPGKYEIEVSASTGDAQWSASIKYAFQIQSPFWKSLWFIGSIVLLFVLLSAYIVRRRISSIRSKAQLKQKIADTEMAALRARMNPHFVFNCLNSIDNLIHANQSDAATKYLNRFAKLIRDVLENAQTAEIPFQKDWENVQRYLDLEQLRFDNQLKISLIASPELFNGNYRVPPFIIQPFLENAIHHGLRNSSSAQKLLEINAELDGDFLTYIISDNGIGREAAKSLAKNQWQEKSSQGISISADRIRLHNKQKHENNLIFEDLKDGVGNAIGTKVIIRIIV